MNAPAPVPTPLVPASVPAGRALLLWAEVVLVANGGRCTCTGQCGGLLRREGRHRGSLAADLRCPVETEPLPAGPPIVVVAPVDLSVSETAAAWLPASDLTAWCSMCLAAARSLAARQRRADLAADVEARSAPLFLVPDSGASSSSPSTVAGEPGTRRTSRTTPARSLNPERNY